MVGYNTEFYLAYTNQILILVEGAEMKANENCSGFPILDISI